MPVMRFVLILVSLAMLSGTCQAADDRKLCGSNDAKADRVIAACRRVVAADPGDLQAVMRLGEILRLGKQYADCVEVYSKGIDGLASPNPQAWAIFYFRGICYERGGRWDKAEVDLRKALELNSDEPHVLNYLGYSLADRGVKIDEAQRMLRRAVEKLPDDGYTLDSLGWVYYRTGNYDEALKTLERAVRLKPDDPTLNDHLGDVLAKLGRTSEARSQWLRARNLKPEAADLKKIEEKIALVPADNTTSRDVTDAARDACRPGLTQITPEARRANLSALDERYKALFQAGKYAEALPLAQNMEVAVRAQAGTRDTRYSIALIALAQVCDRLYDAFEESAALYKSALAIREQISNRKERRNGVGWALTGLGGLYLRYGRLAEAVEYYRRALTFDDSADDMTSDLSNLANVYVWQGKFEEAEQLYKRALPIQEKLGGTDGFSVAILLNNMATLYAHQDRSAEAEALYRRALPVYEKNRGPNNPWVAQVLSSLADVLTVQGRYAEAETLNLRSLAIHESTSGQGTGVVGGGLIGIGILQELQGKYPEAEVTLRRALAILESAFGADNLDTAKAREHLGVVLRAQGKYGEAEPQLKRALAAREQALGASHPDVAATLDNLAVLYSAWGDDKNALAYSRRASAAVIARAASDASSQLDMSDRSLDARPGYFRHHIRNAARASRKGLEPAGALAGEALEIAEWAVQSSAATAVQQMALRFASADGVLASLVRERQDLVSVARTNQKLLVEALSKPDGQRNQVLIDNIRKQITDAESKLAASGARLEREFPDYAALASPKPLKADEVQKLLGTDEALVFLLSGEAESYVFAMTSDAFDWKTIPLGAEAVSQKVAAFRRGLEVDALSRGLTRLECNEEEAKKRGLSRPACGDAVAHECAQANTERGPRFGCIAPMAHLECSEADATARGLSRPQCGESVLKDCADLDRRGLKRPDCDAILDGRPGLFDLGRAYDLYQTLLGPVEGLIKGKRHLLIVPSGALTALPFHLLVTEKPKTATPQLEDVVTAATFAPYREAAWLIKRQAETVLPSVSSLKALRIFARKDQATKPMVGFGDPVFSPEAERVSAGTRTAQARGVTRSYTAFWKGVSIDRGELANALPRLADTADELKKIASSLGAGADDIYLREAASETTVKRIPLSDYRVVYFATHGLVAGEVKGLAEPSLALTLPRQASEADDGLLTASEIAQLKLNANWVVLSACNTVAGDKPGAEALSGLARAFFYAGARALLVSHWAVDSKAATQLTTATFDLLRADPTLGRAEALRRAMLAYLADTSTPMNAYPALWAPFEIVGEGEVK
jgi:tetratricopeptide (TPR) repeat protein/CHAT domain-containing protein